MKIGRDELTNACSTNRRGSKAFLEPKRGPQSHQAARLALRHASRMEDIAEAVADAADVYKCRCSA